MLGTGHHVFHHVMDTLIINFVENGWSAPVMSYCSLTLQKTSPIG